MEYRYKFLCFTLILNSIFCSLVFTKLAPSQKAPTFTDAKTILQLYQLMKDTHEILVSKNIQYWVIAGTLLGAVRHNGIIPWDDDLDICLNKKQINEFISLIPIFEQLEYEVVPWSFGFKIFYKKGLKVYSKFENGKEHYSKIPFVDVFLYEQKNNDITYDWTYFKQPRNRNHIAIYANELFPIKDYKFGNFFVKGPSNPLKYLTCCYGKNCLDTASYGHSHGAAGRIKGTINLSPKDKLPAMPVGPLKDRVSKIVTTRQLSLEKDPISLEIVNVSKNNLEKSKVILDNLKPIFIDAFQKQAEDQLKDEHPEEYEALQKSGLTIKDALASRFNKIVETFLSQINSVNGSYVSTIKNEKKIPVGYVIFVHQSITKILESMITRKYVQSIISLSDEILNSNNYSNDDLYILSIAVSPSYQKQGLGKKLISSMISQIPNAKNIYLLTAASKTNIDVQNFYQHLDFKPKGLVLTSDQNEKILYCFDTTYKK
jgi:GNAT superfamily N-acetyltransferase